MRALPVLVAVLLLSCGSAERGTSSPGPALPAHPAPAVRVEILSAPVPRFRFADSFAACADCAPAERIHLVARALLRYDEHADAWISLHVATEPRDVECSATTPLHGMIGSAPLEPAHTYVVVLDVDGQTELHWIVSTSRVCGARRPREEHAGRVVGCVGLAGGVQWRTVADRRTTACGDTACDVENLEVRAAVPLEPAPMAWPSLHPMLELHAWDGMPADRAHDLAPVALARLVSHVPAGTRFPDSFTWEAVPLDAPRRRVEPDATIDLGEWLGIAFAEGDNYTLRVAMDDELYDVNIMVAGGVCQDIMLAPPIPPGMEPSCIAFGNGALATYLPSARSILDARP